MAILRSLEQIAQTFTHDHVSLGTLAMSAVSYLYTRQVAATRADKAPVDYKPKVESHPSDKGDAVLIFDVGLMQDPKRVKNRLAERVEHLGPSWFVRNSPNDEANKEVQLNIVKSERGRRVIRIGTSKGGKDQIRMMSDPEYMAEHGPVDLLDLDSVPAHKSHIRRSGRAMLWGALMTPESHLAAVTFLNHQRAEAREIGERFVRSLSLESFYETKADIPVLLSTPPADEAIATGLSTENVNRIIMVSSPRDGMVDMVASHRWLEDVTGRTIPFIVDPLRGHGNHAGITDSFELQVREIERHLAGDYEPSNLQQAA